MRKTAKKLVLTRETVNRLADHQLQDVIGGSTPPPPPPPPPPKDRPYSFWDQYIRA